MNSSRILKITTSLILILILGFKVVHAHIVKQEPWHPLPAAYLRTVFYMNLKPVNWELIAGEYNSQHEAGYDYRSVYEILDQLTEFSGANFESEIKSAISSKDQQNLYILSTKAISTYIRYQLSKAQSEIENPHRAGSYINNAKQIFRAFDKFIQDYDPVAYKEIGRSWLSINTSVGKRGILGAAGIPADVISFNNSKNIIEKYLIENYEKPGSQKIEHYLPIPLNSPTTETDNIRFDWLPPGANLNDQVPLPRLVLNFEQRGQDERDLFLVSYGDMLFDSPEILGERARDLGLACSTCHNRSDINNSLFIPGISNMPGTVDVDGNFFNPLFNDHRNDPIDIPSLRGIRFTAPYGRDGRFASLRDFARNVIVNEFAGPEPTPLMLDALVTYMLEFDWLPTPYLNPDGTLNDRSSDEARKGEILFNKKFEGMGDRACSTCHIPSSNFMDGLRHDIRSGKSASPSARDSFFDTPTLINIKYTAPYFHDGSLNTLGEVVEWFDNEFSLNLNSTQKKELTAYLETVGAGEEPFENFDIDNTVFLLDWNELSTFLSTLNTLIPQKDKFHIKLLVDTVSRDLKADAIGLKNLDQSEYIYELTAKMEKILKAVEQDDWQLSASLWLEYQELEKKYSPYFK